MAPLLVVTLVNIVSVPLFYRYLGPEMYALWFYVLTFTGALRRFKRIVDARALAVHGPIELLCRIPMDFGNVHLFVHVGF